MSYLPPSVHQQLAFSLLRHAQDRLRLHFVGKPIAIVKDCILKFEADDDGFEVVDVVKIAYASTPEGFEKITTQKEQIGSEKVESNDVEDFEVVEKLNKDEDKSVNRDMRGSVERVKEADFSGDFDVVGELSGEERMELQEVKMHSRGVKYLEHIVETATFATQYTALLVGLEALIPAKVFISTEIECGGCGDEFERGESVEGRDGNVKLDGSLVELSADYMGIGELVDGKWEA